MDSHATFAQHFREGLPTLEVRGRIRIADAQQWSSQLEELVRRSDAVAVVDMTSCPYIPSLALPPLIGAHQAMSKAGKFLLIAASKDLLEIFQVLRLGTRLRIMASVKECVSNARVLAE